MHLNDFLQQISAGHPVDFNTTMAVIDRYYHYTPTMFHNGMVDPLHNPAGCNEGSCKIFAFARLHGLAPQQTLALFGAYYTDVLRHPESSNHANIRRFLRDGWDGIVFDGQALHPREA
jgi:hypothetical protein